MKNFELTSEEMVIIGEIYKKLKPGDSISVDDKICTWSLKNHDIVLDDNEKYTFKNIYKRLIQEGMSSTWSIHFEIDYWQENFSITIHPGNVCDQINNKINHIKEEEERLKYCENEKFEPIEPIEGQLMSNGMFANCKNLTEIEIIDIIKGD